MGNIIALLPAQNENMARRTSVRRAMSLIELVAVMAVIGLVAAAAITKLGTGTLSNTGAEGCARKLALSLVHARRATIATGENHYVQLYYSGPDVTSYALFRRTGGGDIQVDATHQVPADVVITSASSQLEFSFDGQALAGYTLDVSGTDRSWSVAVVILTGTVMVTETA